MASQATTARLARAPAHLRRMARTWRGPHQGYWGFLFTLPILVLFIGFKFQPMARALALSFTNADAFNPKYNAVGFANYARLPTDPQFVGSLGVTAYYVVGSVVPIVALALGLAVLLNQPLPGIRVYRVLTFLPAVIPIVVVPILWQFLFHPYGLVNVGLQSIGLPATDWLHKKASVIPAFILATDWRLVPLFSVVYLAGLQSIPEDLYDATRVDGASALQRFRWVTLPLLRPTMLVVIIVATLFCARSFVIAYVLTGGGPDNASQTLSVFIYKTAFQFYRVGYASAASMALLVIMLVVTVANLRIFRSDS
jgi:multiple sugar transport system permease protein